MTRILTWHRRLPVRLFAAIVLVAAFAVAATAWLAVHTTRDVIEHEQDRAVASNEQVYSTLIAYAATHTAWTDARTVIAALARTTGLRITLVAPGARLDTGSGGNPPGAPSITVDPLDVEASVTSGADAQHIERAAVGPFRLPAAARPRLLALARKAAYCLGETDATAKVVVSPAGRPYLQVNSRNAASRCIPHELSKSTRVETTAAGELESMFRDCLPADRRGAYKVVYVASAVAAPVIAVYGTPGVWTTDGPIPSPAGDCLLLARHRLLSAYVAPAAQVYLTDESGKQVSTTSVPHVSASRVVIAGAVVVALAALVAAFGAVRLGRPLRSVTQAARRMRHGDTSARVPLRSRHLRRRSDDVTELAVAFNELAAAVENGERQRQDMVADISHELRSPLTNITGWVEALQDGVAEPDPKTLATIVDQAHQLERVVDDLRDLALAEAGELHLNPVSIPLVDLVEQVSAAFTVHARDSGIELESRVTDPAFVTGDPVRLAQCLSNLVSNAIAHTPAGGHVMVLARTVNDRAVLDVTDDGTGISATDLPHVFDRLWRAERSRNRRAGGSGLGLTIARRIARAHHGDITATSHEGHGSTFTLTLPLGLTAVSPRDTQPRPISRHVNRSAKSEGSTPRPT